MNTFSSTSRTTISETIISRFVALLAIGMLSALPAVAGANSVPNPNHVDTQFAHAELFGGAVVRLLSTEEMFATQGRFSFDELLDWTEEAVQVIGEAADLHQETFVSSGEEPNHNNQAYTMINGHKVILPHHLINISQGDPFLTDIVNVLFALTYVQPDNFLPVYFHIYQVQSPDNDSMWWHLCCEDDGEVPESLAHLVSLPSLSRDGGQNVAVSQAQPVVQPSTPVTPSPYNPIDPGHFPPQVVPENQTPNPEIGNVGYEININVNINVNLNVNIVEEDAVDPGFGP